MKLPAYLMCLGTLSLSGVWLLGIQQCQPQETCDGVDNDGDGQIDEDFDEDFDGYYSAAECSYGDDCVDSDPEVHPNNAEPQDGKDNDCDGKVDEAQKLYVVKLEGEVTGNPIVGRPVWPEADGSGPLDYTDSNGEAMFYLEQPYSVLTYNTFDEDVFPRFTVATSANVTYLSLSPSEYRTIYFGEGTSYETLTRSGEVSGIDLAVPEGYTTDLELTVGGMNTSCLTYLGVATAETMPFTVSCGQMDWAFVREQFILPETGESYYGGDLPHLIGLAPDTGDPLTIVLDHSLDNQATFLVSGVDDRMSNGTRNRYISAPGYDYYLSIGYDTFSVTGDGSYPISTATLDGTFTGANYWLDLTFSDDTGSAYQDVSFFAVTQSDATLQSPLLPVPATSGYTSPTTATLPGTTFQVTNDDRAQGEGYFWISNYYNSTGTALYVNTWTVEQTDVSAPIVVPELPAGFDLWPAAALEDGVTESSTDLVITYAPQTSSSGELISARTLGDSGRTSQDVEQLRTWGRETVSRRATRAPFPQ